MGNLVTVKNNYDNGVCSGFTIYTGTTYNGHPFTIPPSANSIGFHTLPHTFDIGYYSGPLYVFLEHCDNHISPPPNEDPKKQGGFQVVLIDVDCEVCPPNSDSIDCTMIVSFVENKSTDCNFTVTFDEILARPTPTPTNTDIPDPTPTPTSTPTPTPTSGPCVCIEFTNASSGDRLGYYNDCYGNPQTVTVGSYAIEEVCGNGNNITVSDGKLNYSVNGDCVDGVCGESPTPTPTATENIQITAIILSNTSSEPTNANCDEGNDGEIENRVYVIYNTSWFTTNSDGKNVVKSTFSLTDNEIINGGGGAYTIHPNSIWSGTPTVFRNSSDGTYMIADESTEGNEKLLFIKNFHYGVTNKCDGNR